jgi:hypothetical protein
MKKNYYVLGLSLLLLVSLVIEASPTITFFFKPLGDVEKIIKKLKKPGNLAKHTIRGIIQPAPVAGILVTYAGYVASSDYNGGIVLPRKHYKSMVTIVVTPEMVPVPLFENTYLHWNLISGVPAKMYSCEQKYDEMKEEAYWDVQELSFLAGNQIPVSAIVIVAKPKDIVINVGTTPTVTSANLVLPEVYVKKGINIVKNSSYMLTIRHLFKPITVEEKPEPFKMLTHIND